MHTEHIKVRKNDTVKVVTGKDKGKTGKVIRVLSNENLVLVEKINVIKRHVKQSQQNPQGGIIEKEAPINASNVMVMCGNCNVATRVKTKKMDSGKLVRACRKCDSPLNK